MCVLLPLVLKAYPCPVVTNGGFEQGLDGWQSNGELAVGTSTGEAHGGIGAALLGSPNYDCESAPEGSARLSQWIQVPNAGSPMLRFWYRIFTYDRNERLHDNFDYLNVLVAGQQVLRDMNCEGEYGRCDLPPSDLGWREGAVDLSTWRGQEVELRFLLHTDHEYNTWVYVDDVSMQ